MDGRLDRTLEVIEWFNADWFSKHGSVWTDQHNDEYEEAKRQFLNKNADYIMNE